MAAADVLREWWQMLSRRMSDLDRFGSYNPDLIRPGFYTGELDALCWKVRELEKQVEALQEQVRTRTSVPKG